MRSPQQVRGALLAVLVALAGCSRGGCSRSDSGVASNPTDGKPRRGGTIVIAIPSDPASLMPYAAAAYPPPASDVLSLIYDDLCDTQPDIISFTPRVARSWEWSDDKTLVFHLRENARWSDGTPLTADDVLFTYEVARDTTLQWPGARWKKDIQACEVVDPHTVRFRFTKVPREAVRWVREGFLVPKHLLQGVPRDQWDKSDFGQHPIGSGPFKFESWTPQQNVVLVRNEYFYEPDEPYLDRIVLRIVPDKTTQVRLLRSGEVDFIEDLTPRQCAELAADKSGPRLLSCKGRQYDYIAYNPKSPLFADVRVREALTRGIDRQAIARDLLSGLAEPLDGPVVPIMWAYDPGLERIPYDPEGARRLLSEAGWRDADGDGVLDRDGRRFAFTLSTNSDDERRTMVIVPVQSNWKAIGVQADLRTFERSTLIEQRNKGNFDAVLGGWSTNLAMDISGVWGCKSRNNFIKYCNARVDSLSDVAAYLPYEQAKPALYEMQRLVARDRPYTFMYYIYYTTATTPRLQNARITPIATVFKPETWWVTDGEVAKR